MTYQPLRSTAIAAAGYDPDTRELELEFTSGETYTYEDVPPEVYQELIASRSPGRFYHQSIKDAY